MDRTIPKLHPRQREVFSAVYAVPDLSLNEIARLLKVNCAIVAYAVCALERRGLLASTVRSVATDTPRRARRLCRLVRPAEWTVV